MWVVKNPRPAQPTERWLAGLQVAPNPMDRDGRCLISNFGALNVDEALVFADEGNAKAAATLTGGVAMRLKLEVPKNG